MLLRERLRSRRGRQVPTVHVRVRAGYEPSVLYGRVGEPLRIVFSREETAACSEHVVFPAFGKSAMLPPFEDVLLELVPEHAGEYEFTCQLGMLRGRLVVDGDGTARSVSTTSADASPTAGSWSGSIASEHGDMTTITYASSRGG